MPGVVRVGLAGDHLRTIVDWLSAEAIEARLRQAGLRLQRLERGEPSLEDVFLTLARE